jgi:hypothetical protein
MERVAGGFHQPGNRLPPRCTLPLWSRDKTRAVPLQLGTDASVIVSKLCADRSVGHPMALGDALQAYAIALAQLLRLRFQNPSADTLEDLGGSEEVGQLFAGF